jgi:hypothetical protein
MKHVLQMGLEIDSREVGFTMQLLREHRLLHGSLRAADSSELERRVIPRGFVVEMIVGTFCIVRISTLTPFTIILRNSKYWENGK